MSTSPHFKYSKSNLHFSNVDPKYFAKMRPKVVHNLAIYQLAPMNIDPQIRRKLVQAIKNIKCSYILKLRIGHCSPENLKKVMASLRTFKGLHSLKLNFSGFERNEINELRILPTRLACYERRLKNLSLEFALGEIELDTILHLASLFLKRHIALKSFSAKFEGTTSGDLTMFSKRLQKHGSSLASLNLDFSSCCRMRHEWIHDLTSRRLNNLPNLKRLSLKLGTTFVPPDFPLTFNLSKSKELVSFNFNSWKFYAGIAKDFGSLTEQLRKWSLSLEALHIKFIYMDSEPLEVLTKSLADLKSVKSLKFEFTKRAPVTQDLIKGLASGLKASGVLKILHLEMMGCDLDHDKLEALIQGIKENISLQNLKLNFSKNAGVGREGINNLFGVLKELKELEALNLILEDCGIDNSNIDPLASSIEKLAKLEKLKLSLHFTRDMIELDLDRLSASFSELPSLSTLRLNLFNIKVTDKVIENMKKMKSLQKLTLFFNGNEGIQEIGPIKKFSGLFSIPMLRNLSLNILRPSQEDLWDLFYYLENMRKLKALRIGFYGKEVDFEEAMERYTAMMKSLGGQLKSFEMAFYHCNSLESNFITDFLRGLEQLKQAENISLEMVVTGLKDDDWETMERVVENLLNMKTLRRFHYRGNQII